MHVPTGERLAGWLAIYSFLRFFYQPFCKAGRQIIGTYMIDCPLHTWHIRGLVPSAVSLPSPLMCYTQGTSSGGKREVMSCAVIDAVVAERTATGCPNLLRHLL